jgi:Protein of unknown function (DUF3800)
MWGRSPGRYSRNPRPRPPPGSIPGDDTLDIPKPRDSICPDSRNGGDSEADEFTGIELIIGPTIGQDDPAKRLVMVVCYLDDSGTHDESPIVTLAGYVGPYPHWINFERVAKPLKGDDVPVIEGKKLHRSKGCFAGWKVRRKHDFIRAFQAPLGDTAYFGITFSVHKKNYLAAKEDHNKNRNESAFGYCFRMVLDQVLRAAVIREALRKRPDWRLSIVLERGNPNNGDALRIFNQHLFHEQVGKILGTFSTAAKDSTISLQMADVLAYYSRRYVESCERLQRYAALPDMMKILVEGRVPIANEVATAFSPTKAGLPLTKDAGFLKERSGYSEKHAFGKASSLRRGGRPS